MESRARTKTSNVRSSVGDAPLGAVSPTGNVHGMSTVGALRLDRLLPAWRSNIPTDAEKRFDMNVLCTGESSRLKEINDFSFDASPPSFSSWV